MGPRSALRFGSAHKRKASTSLALAWSEKESAELLLKPGKGREAASHLYFGCFHAAHALLADRVAATASHKSVEAQLHLSFKRRGIPPRRYVRLHSRLHILRTTMDYRSASSTDMPALRASLAQLDRYLRWVTRVVPRVELLDVLTDIVSTHSDLVEELSFEIYHPSPYYGGQTRLTLWQPAHDVRSFTPGKLIQRARAFLSTLEADFPDSYVAGLNSRLNQYGEPIHLLMLDLDTTDPSVEAALGTIGGTLLKSGRGFHFIGRELIKGQRRWESRLRRLKKQQNLSGFVDPQYIQFSLLRGYSTLRLTAGGDKPHTPFFYKDL